MFRLEARFPSLSLPLTLTDRKYRINYECRGTTNASLPTFVMQVGGGHVMCEMVPLEEILLSQGRRVCLWEHPGMGYSSARYKGDLEIDADLFDAVMRSIGEPGPFIVL